MRKFLLCLSLFAMTLMASAQDPTLKARSVYDVNQDDKVTVQDVPALVSKLAGITTTDKTAVDTESLMNVLNGLKSQYDKLVEQYAKIIELLTSHEERFSAVEDKLGITKDTHEYVVIGGKKWSTMNLGATTVAGSYATCAGDFYAWGETTPRYTGISWSGSTATLTGISKPYNSSNYPSYIGSTLDAAHDAVTSHADWGEGWRTPTVDDFKALYAACGGTGTNTSPNSSGSTSTTAKGIYWCSNYDGVAGLLFCDGTNQLFFPASGYVAGTSHYSGGSCGYYWSSSLHPSNTYSANNLGFYSSTVNPSSSYRDRCYGVAVRPVSD